MILVIRSDSVSVKLLHSADSHSEYRGWNETLLVCIMDFPRA